MQIVSRDLDRAICVIFDQFPSHDPLPLRAILFLIIGELKIPIELHQQAALVIYQYLQRQSHISLLVFRRTSGQYQIDPSRALDSEIL